ncbi:hypothetical protein JHK86_006853 [Glycine max]|nr:hypothetical protein JHK86_006853 [Glycine max]
MVGVCTQVVLSACRIMPFACVGESQLTPLDSVEEQRLRSRCWVVAAGPKCKGHLYGSSSSAEDAAEMNRLREELHLSKEEMCVFQSVVLQFLPREAGTLFINNNNLTNSRTMQITNRGTLFMTILTTDLASQNYY